MFPGRGHPNGFFHDPNPVDFLMGDKDMEWGSQDHQQAGDWDYRHGRREEGFRDRWHSPFSRDIEPYPTDFYGGDNNECWAAQDHQQPARWENQPRRCEEGFRDGWHSAPPPYQHCPESSSREEHGNSWDRDYGFFPRKYRGCGWKHHRGPFRGGYRGKFDPHYHSFQSCSSKERFKLSKSSLSHSPERGLSSRKRCVSSKTEKAKSAAPRKPGKSKKGSATPVQPEASQNSPDSSSQATSALDTEPPASAETTEDLHPMRDEGTGLVQLWAGLEAADNPSPACCPLATDSVLADSLEDLCLLEEEIELVQGEASHEATDHPSQAISDLTADPPAPPETTEELHPIKTEDTELSPQLQPEDHPNAPDLLSQAVSALAPLPPPCSEIPEELPAMGREEIQLTPSPVFPPEQVNLLPLPCLKSTQEQLAAHQEDAGCPHRDSARATPPEAMEYLRSAAVLARKEEIELSYRQSSLAFAVVATLLLEREPSMEAAMESALRANLRQVGGHCLQELERFISSYDAGAAHS